MKKHVRERLERNRALGKQDAANRCRFCKRQPVTEFWKPFCSRDCWADYTEAYESVAAERVKGLR